jgi:hypothetical protein
LINVFFQYSFNQVVGRRGENGIGVIWNGGNENGGRCEMGMNENGKGRKWERGKGGKWEKGKGKGRKLEIEKWERGKWERRAMGKGKWEREEMGKIKWEMGEMGKG